MSQDPNYEPTPFNPDEVVKVFADEEKGSHYIQRKDQYGRPINIPVLDVRDGIAERMLAMSIIKATNRSKYITYNEYHVSRKQMR